MAHTYELLHGVSLSCNRSTPGCVRYSLITWFQEGQAACELGRWWPTRARRRQVEANLPALVAAARDALGVEVDGVTARRALSAHVDETGGFSRAAFVAALADLRAGLAAPASARADAIEANLARFLGAVKRALRREDVTREQARRAMQAHANAAGDFVDGRTGAVQKVAMMEAFAMVRLELEEEEMRTV